MKNAELGRNYRPALLLVGNKKAGRNFRPALVTQLKFLNQPQASWTGLTKISCGKKPTPLLLFGGGLLFRDGFFDRLFRRWGLGGFFGHEKNLDMFLSDGTQIFPSRHRFVSAPTSSLQR
jgi:hypothetical protein